MEALPSSHDIIAQVEVHLLRLLLMSIGPAPVLVCYCCMTGCWLKLLAKATSSLTSMCSSWGGRPAPSSCALRVLVSDICCRMPLCIEWVVHVNYFDSCAPVTPVTVVAIALVGTYGLGCPAGWAKVAAAMALARLQIVPHIEAVAAQPWIIQVSLQLGHATWLLAKCVIGPPQHLVRNLAT